MCLRKHTSREYKPQPQDFASLCFLADDLRKLHWREDKRNTDQGWAVLGSGPQCPGHPRRSGALNSATSGASQASDGQKIPGGCFRQGISFWKLITEKGQTLIWEADTAGFSTSNTTGSWQDHWQAKLVNLAVPVPVLWMVYSNP